MLRYLKEKIGIILFTITYVAIFCQILGVYYTSDDDILTSITVNKIYFSVIAFLAIASHIRASFTNPGRINHSNNLGVIELYLRTHKSSFEKAEQMNIMYRKVFETIKRFSPEDDDHSEDDSGDEDIIYNTNSQISDDRVKELSKDFQVNFERCKKCNVVRVPHTHHCSKCKYCIIKMDHHCPWINNCVGLFNQKFFILFCFYCVVGCSHASIMTCYYMIYKHTQDFLSDSGLIAIFAVQITTALLFIIFNLIMLWDQWTMIREDTTLIDNKMKRFVESRSIFEVLIEVFGEGFSPFWCLPVDRSNRKIKKDASKKF